MRALCIAWVATFLALSAAAENFRSWTDTVGRTLEAEFVRRDGDFVVLRNREGAELKVPSSSFSRQDLDWLKQFPIPTESGMAQPAALTAWPDRVVLEDKADVEILREDPEKREFAYASEHYEFHSDSKLSTTLVREFSRIFEVTWLANCVFPLDLKPRPEGERKKFLARIFTNREDYLAAGGVPGSAGIYSPTDQALMLPLESLGVKMVGSRVSIDYQAENYRTLIHEITHQVMNRWLWRLPVWFIEGSAEYVELADYDNGRLDFRQLDRRLRDHLLRDAPVFSMVPLQKLMPMQHQEWSAALTGGDSFTNYASALALTYFFYHHDGKGDGAHLISWLRALETIRTPGAADRDAITKAALETHLLRGRSFPELETEIITAFRKEGIKVEFR